MLTLLLLNEVDTLQIEDVNYLLNLCSQRKEYILTLNALLSKVPEDVIKPSEKKKEMSEKQSLAERIYHKQKQKTFQNYANKRAFKVKKLNPTTHMYVQNHAKVRRILQKHFDSGELNPVGAVQKILNGTVLSCELPKQAVMITRWQFVRMFHRGILECK